jgi:hypothetical protein
MFLCIKLYAAENNLLKPVDEQVSDTEEGLPSLDIEFLEQWLSIEGEIQEALLGNEAQLLLDTKTAAGEIDAGSSEY